MKNVLVQLKNLTAADIKNNGAKVKAFQETVKKAFGALAVKAKDDISKVADVLLGALLGELSSYDPDMCQKIDEVYKTIPDEDGTQEDMDFKRYLTELWQGINTKYQVLQEEETIRILNGKLKQCHDVLEAVDRDPKNALLSTPIGPALKIVETWQRILSNKDLSLDEKLARFKTSYKKHAEKLNTKGWNKILLDILHDLQAFVESIGHRIGEKSAAAISQKLSFAAMKKDPNAHLSHLANPEPDKKSHGLRH